MGVGLGGNPNIYPAYGFTADRRAARFAEGLRLMKRLWTEPRVTLEGEFFRLQNASMEPKPVQKPHPPLWFGAHHPNALRRTAQMGDAFMGAGSLSTAKFAEEVQMLRRLLEAAGRDPAAFPIAKRVYIAVDRDKARAGSRLRDWFGAFYGRPQMAGGGACGPAEECIAGLRDVVAAGRRCSCSIPFDEMEHLEVFASESAPILNLVTSTTRRHCNGWCFQTMTANAGPASASGDRCGADLPPDQGAPGHALLRRTDRAQDLNRNTIEVARAVGHEGPFRRQRDGA